MNNQQSSPDQLYAAYFEPYDISEFQRSGSDEKLLLLQQLYADEKYKEALPLLGNQLNSSELKPSQLLLASGIAYLELDQPKEALNYFNQITEKGDFNFEDEVLWYSGLAYLRMENIEEAKNVFDALSKSENSDRSDDAKKILKKL